ncbi:hypothetical protein ACFLTU_03150 [Bacteroidota bacterium]
MKNLELLFLTLGIFFCSCSTPSGETIDVPDNKYRLIKLHYDNSDGEEGVTHFYYNREGNNYMAIWQLADSSRSSLNYHSLDSAGRIIKKSRDFSDGIKSVQHFEYDRKGNLLSEDFSRSDSVTGLVNYIYTEDGKLQSADCRGLNGWFYGQIMYEWEDGKKVAANLMRDSVSIGNIVYEYEDMRLIREHWDFDGKWSQTFAYEYQKAARQSYTSPNVFICESPWFRISSEYYEFNGKQGGPSLYTYDETGRLIEKEYIRSDGLRTLSTYQYDSTGLLDLSLRDYQDGRSTDFLYWYSVDRQLLVKTFMWSDSTSGSETYRYEDGLLKRGEYVNVDGWLNGILDINCSSDGIVSSASFKGNDGFDAELNFAYDRNFNLTKIHWEFSSGDNQSYFFKYLPY